MRGSIQKRIVFEFHSQTVHVPRPLTTMLVAVGLLAASCSSLDGADTVGSETAAPVTRDPSSTTAPPTTIVPTTQSTTTTTALTTTEAPLVVRTGAGILVDEDFRSLASDRLGLIVNQTAMVDGRHLIDLVAESPVVELGAVFAPEHGVRGVADAGEAVGDTTDPTTGVPIYSLYGQTRAPTPAMLSDIDVLVYDLQDVGTRFYTYISTMGLAMQVAAAADKPFVVLDRPNPLGGDVVAGFTRTSDQESFVSQYPIPSVYGLTAGELAQAIVGEAWLPGLENLQLRIIPVEGWDRSARWPQTGLEWIAPSPGLPSADAALAYPGTVLFETTTLSYGKGTEHPFSTIGAPWIDGPILADRLNQLELPGVTFDPVSFTPDPALAPNPRLAGVALEGIRYQISDPVAFEPTVTGVHVLVEVRDLGAEVGAGTIVDRRPMFNLLAGDTRLLSLLDSGATAPEIIAEWQGDNEAFDELRQPYLLYP